MKLLNLFVYLSFNFYLVGAIDENLTEIESTFLKKYPISIWKMYGFFEINYVGKINSHWLKFPPQPKIYHHVLAGIYGLIMTVGVSGNFLVIFLFIRCKNLRTPANILVVNLAISDFLMMSKMPIFIYNSVYAGPALGDVACRYYGFVGGLSGTCSICTLSTISLDRFYVIKYPLNRRFTSLRAKISVAVSWIYALIFSSIPLMEIGLGTYTPEGFLTSCSYDYLTNHLPAKTFILIFFMAAWIVPFTIIIFSYTNIIKVVKISKNLTKEIELNSKRHMKIERKRKQEIRLAFIVFFVIVLWFLAWTPYAIISLFGIFGFKNFINPFTSMIPALFCKTASCIDPFVYALIHLKFKNELFDLLGWQDVKKKKDTFRLSVTRTEILDDDFSKSEQNKIGNSMIITEKDLKRKTSKYKPRWWFKPSFSNRSSSLRTIARQLSSLKRKNKEDIMD